MDTETFTKKLIISLQRTFPSGDILQEWNVAKESRDDFNNQDYYAPRVDVAIGPFNIDRNLDRNNKLFDTQITQNSTFIKRLYSVSHLGENHEYIMFNDYLRTLNRNRRCFIAIEVENTKVAKRALGDIVNASVMGKIGIIVPLGEDKYNMFIKIKKYFHYLEQVGKLGGNFRNILIIEGTKLLNVF